jgi:hypothetical protein
MDCSSPGRRGPERPTHATPDQTGGPSDLYRYCRRRVRVSDYIGWYLRVEGV